MAPKRDITRDRILKAGVQLAIERGVQGVTFQSIADALGVSKQAVIHWYPSKRALFHDFAVRLLRAEAETVTRAVEGSSSAREAIEGFVRAVIGHHLADLAGFKLVYVVMQVAQRSDVATARSGLEEIHAITSAMYGALERHIVADARHRASDNPRAAAVAVHMAAIGLVTMVSLTQSMDDPLLHPTDRLVDSLVLLVS